MTPLPFEIPLLTLPRWPPLLTGGGISILAALSLLLVDRPLGITTGFVKIQGLLTEAVLGKEAIIRNEYYRLIPPALDGPLLILPGILIGAFLAALMGGTLSLTSVPPLWAATFSSVPAPRLAAAFAGGALIGLGSRWAGGCTSGHGISGSMQLSLASILSTVCFFAGGIATALFIYTLAGGV